MNATTVPAWPKITATIHDDGTATVVINGRSHAVAGTTPIDVRAEIARVCAETATKVHRPVRVIITDPEGERVLIVHPNGDVDELSVTQPTRAERRRRRRETATTVVSVTEAPNSVEAPAPTPEPTPGNLEPDHAADTDIPAVEPGALAVEPGPPHQQAPWGPSTGSLVAEPEHRTEPEAPVSEPLESDTASGLLWQEVIDKHNSQLAELIDQPIQPEPEPPRHDHNFDRSPPPRRLLHTLSGRILARWRGQEPESHELAGRITAPLHGHHRIAVLSLKGGVGKTTTTVGLGSTLATQRESRVVAVDANPDHGTLGTRLPLETDRTVRELTTDANQIQSYSQIRQYTSANADRLQVIASDATLTAANQYDADDYKTTANLLAQYYDLVVTDCGTGIGHSVMSAVLGMADQAVIVLEPAEDAVAAALATLDWLEQNEYVHLAASAIVVLSRARTATRHGADIARMRQRFDERTRGTVAIPDDPHLRAGGHLRLAQLREPTRHAYQRLAALTVESLIAPRSTVYRNLNY